MKTDIQPVHLAITFRKDWNEYEPHDPDHHPNLFRATHEASHDKFYLWEYWDEYFHCRLRLINPVLNKERTMDKKTWKKLYRTLRYDECQEFDEAECPNL